jgi:OmpA-OmpF porin, OOP family
MNLIEPLLREATERFSLGNGASPLFSSLLALIVNPQNGGIAGFFSRFQQAGLGNLISSWMGRGENIPISPNQLEQVLGGDTVGRLAASAGLPAAAAAPAMAFMLPKLIDFLTPDGAIPSAIPAWASAYLPASLSGLTAPAGVTERSVDRDYSANYPTPTDGSRRSAAAVLDRPADEPVRSGGGGWWKWLLPLLLLGLLGWLFSQFLGRRPEPQPAVEAPAANSPATTAAPPTAAVNSTLSLNNVDGTVQYSGVVPDEPTKTTIVDNLKQAFGDRISGDLTVNPAAKAAAWLPGLGGALAAFNLPGASLNIDGDTINVGGALPDAEKTAMIDKLKSAFGSQFKFGDAAASGGATSPAATTQTAVKDLNLDNINFETGSAEITADSMSVVEKDAEAIKALPAGTKIEIGGHTDNTGDANFNRTLSEDRANAVKDELVRLGVDANILTATGYGSDKAIADNNTEEGRLKNRRIEFTIVP